MAVTLDTSWQGTAAKARSIERALQKAAWAAGAPETADGQEDEDRCGECGEPVDGDGHDGLCGDCADRAESEGRWD